LFATALFSEKPTFVSATTRFKCGLFAPVAPCAALMVNETVPPPAGTVTYVPTYPVDPKLQALPLAAPVERAIRSLPLIVVCACAFTAVSAATAKTHRVTRFIACGLFLVEAFYD